MEAFLKPLVPDPGRQTLDERIANLSQLTGVEEPIQNYHSDDDVPEMMSSTHTFLRTDTNLASQQRSIQEMLNSPMESIIPPAMDKNLQMPISNDQGVNYPAFQSSSHFPLHTVVFLI
jgi:hypothetical protein